MEEVKKIISTLKNTSAVGYDNISIDVIKNNIPYLIKNITTIINKSLSTGEVPETGLKGLECEKLVYARTFLLFFSDSASKNTYCC